MAELVGPLLVIVGETASGKSSLALEVAKQIDGEVICADSWTVYKGFDIGTAKPTVDEQALVRHHLLDVAEPAEGFNAVKFQRLAKEAIADIQTRGKLPILVGGTGLYVDSVIFDYGFLPPTDPGLHQELNSLGLDALLKRVEDMGLDTSAIDTRNKRRIIRLIENNGVLPTRQGLRPHTLIVGMRVLEAERSERIETRVDQMLDAGLEQEVARLSEKYGWDIEPMKGIGYVEWRSYFAGTQNLVETRQKIVADTKNLAKRQRTWFKRNKSIQWISNRGNMQDIVEEVTTKLHKL